MTDSTGSAPLRVVVPLTELLPDVREAVDRARVTGTGDVSEAVGRLFDFLGPYTTAEIRSAHDLDPEERTAARRSAATSGAPAEGEFLVLRFTPPAGRDPVAAERRFVAVTARADRGDVRGAKPELLKLVREFPEVAKYHRALGQAHFVAGEADEAEDALLHALRLDPLDADALTLLGNLYHQRGRREDAIPLYRRSVAVERNVYALTNLAASLAGTGRLVEAVEVFRDAVREDENHANAWYGLGLALTNLRDPAVLPEAIAACDRALGVLGARGRGSHVWDAAQGLVGQLSSVAVRESLLVAEEAIRSTITAHELAAAAGQPDRLPVQVEEALPSELGSVLAKIEFGWVHHRPYHRLRIGPASGQALLVREHLILHELEHLDLSLRARASRTNRFFATNAETEKRALDAVGPDVRRRTKQGHPAASMVALAESMVSGLLGQLFNFPVDLLIESRLVERYAHLRELVFLSLRGQLETGARLAHDPQVRRVTPTLIVRANTAMNGAMALWLEEQFPHRTDLVERFAKADVQAWSLAKRLYARWQADRPAWTPGGEYEWIDTWAGMLNLRGWYVWRDGNPADATDLNEEGGLDA